MFKNKYRVVHGKYQVVGFEYLSGYLPQVKYWWFPFSWFNFNETVYKTKDDAIHACECHDKVFKC